MGLWGLDYNDKMYERGGGGAAMKFANEGGGAVGSYFWAGVNISTMSLYIAVGQSYLRSPATHNLKFQDILHFQLRSSLLSLPNNCKV